MFRQNVLKLLRDNDSLVMFFWSKRVLGVVFQASLTLFFLDKNGYFNLSSFEKSYILNWKKLAWNKNVNFLFRQTKYFHLTKCLSTFGI